MKRRGSKLPSLAPTPTSPAQIVAAMRRTVACVRAMPHAERVQSLKDAGILTRTSKLSAAYR